MTFSPIVENHWANPRNMGCPAHFDAKGVAGDPHAGPFMIVYLSLEKDSITEAAFETYGCGAAIAAGSLTTELIKGRSLEFAREIDAGVVRTLLGGLPLGKEHCAGLAAAALAHALKSIPAVASEHQVKG